ncbi:MAG TPA: hypothetical protein DHW82_06505 [Spirochaetia bacterium]|nr:MAG: hypothetical protein A2Y41_03115 [Spirochaetes bacterium GWB1_36_13]HCL56644.1 hypothetical protein [Spirochaetia bacterium]
MEDERRRKKQLREGIDFIEDFMNQLKKDKPAGVDLKSVDESLSILKLIIQSVRGYHASVKNLLSSFELLYENMEDIDK